MYFRNYGLQNTWLNQRLTSTISDYPLKSSMENAPKSVKI